MQLRSCLTLQVLFVLFYGVRATFLSHFFSDPASLRRKDVDEGFNRLELEPTRDVTHQRGLEDTRIHQYAQIMDPAHFTAKEPQRPPEYSDDSDLEPSDDEQKMLVQPRHLSKKTAKMSNTPTTDDMGDDLEKITKPSKNHPTWSVVQGSVGRAMPEWKDVPPHPSL
ncbi:hypothetical protein HPB50_029233 [Hyalomma asiaticum]|nr:hypothetical protein HPB50_029233 [Hyalomma asiaticum]